MRIVTYNIHGWRTAGGESNWAAIGDVLETLDASVVGLNEVFYPRVVPGAAGPALEALAARLGMYFVFGPCLRWPAEHNMPATAYGNALLSRWPILASSAHHLTAKEEDKEGLLARLESRGLLEGRILLPNGQTLTVYVTHLDHTDAAARWVQLRVARTWLARDRHRPHLVMGDFNAVSRWDAADPPSPGDRAFQAIDAMEKAGYVDLYRHFGSPGAATFLAGDEPARIDYLFASPALLPAATGCTIWAAADGVSDHRPVLADLDLERLFAG